MRLTANFVLSADAKISTGPHAASGFGSPEDHARLLLLRRRADALLVGRSTLLADRMGMGSGDAPSSPARIIAGFSDHPPADHPVFSTPGGPVHVFVSAPLRNTARQALGQAATVHALDTREKFPPALAALATAENWQHVHCEGGPTLLRYLLGAGAVDQLHLTITPRLFGGLDAPTLLGPGHAPPFPGAHAFVLEDADFHGEEAFLTYSKRSG